MVRLTLALALTVPAHLLAAKPIAGFPELRPLLRNGGFETDGGWSLGMYTRVVAEEPHTGKRCLRADGDRGAAVEQAVWSFATGQAVSVSGWIRTREVAASGGGFAFLALYEYNSQGHLVRFVDFAKVTGTTPWTVYEYTTRLTPTTEYVVLRAGIHAATGTAWFDDLNLVAGDKPIAWTDSRPGLSQSPAYRAAILDEPSLPVQGAATPVRTFRRVFTSLGLSLTSLTAGDIENGALSPDRFDLFIVPTGATFPVTCRKALLAFLTAGGDLLCTGGYAFDQLVVREGNKWTAFAKYQERQRQRARRTHIENGGFEDGSNHWLADGPACSIEEGLAASGSRSGKVTVQDAGQGSRWTHRLTVEPGKTYLIGAALRYENVHGSHYAYLAVYQYDAEGKLLAFRDFAQVTGSQDWTRREAVISIHPQATTVLFHAGLYLAAGTLWVDDVTCGELPSEERINGHYGEPGDALRLAPAQLTLFNPDQPLDAAMGVASWPGWPRIVLRGPFRGYDATAQLRNSARYQPLVEGRDAYGRLAGALGALVTHFQGPFGGSRWALFGTTSRDAFSGSAGLEILRRTVQLLAQPVAAASLTTNYAMYDHGETVRIELSVVSPRGWSTGPALNVDLVMDAPGRRTATLYGQRRSLLRGQPLPMSLAFTYKLPKGTPDFVRVRAVLRDGAGITVDWIETGFCVRDPQVIAAGPRIRYRDNGFALEVPGRPPRRTTLFGTDTYANMFLSLSCNPLTWFRDLKAMRDHGLHMFENLQYAPAGWQYGEEEWRRMDALIQLSQRFGLPYMAGLLIGQDVAVDDTTLQAQAEMCRSFARRYRHIPGLIYYLNGDFQLHMKDTPDLRRLWNAFLQERYGSDAALRAAWGGEAPPEPLGQIPPQDFTSALPFSPRVCDTRLFQVRLMNRWVSTLTSAIREVDPDHPITSEYYQRPMGGIDLRLTLDGMDAANFGYFGPPSEDIAQLLATIKWNDMRRANKSINIGEFGVKTHDAWTVERGGTHYHIARTEEDQRRQLWWIVHAAMAYDVTKIQNWCWADDPDGVFPWGIAYSNPLRPKPVLRLWRNLRLFSELIPHEYQPAPVIFVMPDSWRAGAPDTAAWKGIATALECLLASGVRFDVVNEDQVLSIVPGSVRLVVAPFAGRMPSAQLAHLRAIAEQGATVYLSGLNGEIAVPAGSQISVPFSGAIRYSLGKGTMVVAQAWEAAPGVDVFLGNPEFTANAKTNHYLQLVQLADVRPSPHVVSAEGVWRTVARTAKNRTLVAALPVVQGSSIKLVHDGHRLEWLVSKNIPQNQKAPWAGWPCAAVLDGSGGVLGATGNGSLKVNMQPLAQAEGPWMIASLDGLPITRSRRLAVCAARDGALKITRSWPGLRAYVVECDGETLRPVGIAPMTGRGTLVQVQAPANELILLTTESYPPERAANRAGRQPAQAAPPRRVAR